MSKINQTVEDLVSIAYSGLNFEKQPTRYFSDEELEKGMELVLADMEKYKALGWNVVTFDEICEWLKTNKQHCKDSSSYGIKHYIERDWRVVHQTRFMYCANNWAKFAMVYLGWNFVEELKFRSRIFYTKPCFADLMRNEVNWFPIVK